jgi:calcium-dependent protein kinase
MQRLKSPNIVQLMDVMETSNNYYIIQEFCDSGDLDGYLAQHKQMSEKDSLKFLNDILNGFI